MLPVGTDNGCADQYVSLACCRQPEFPTCRIRIYRYRGKAAYSADAVYTPQDVSHIVSYAGQVRPPLFLSSSIQPSRSGGSTFLLYVVFQDSERKGRRLMSIIGNRHARTYFGPRPSRKLIWSTSRAPMRSPGGRMPANRPRANCTSPLPRRSISRPVF
jgi:hypothetical protein